MRTIVIFILIIGFLSVINCEMTDKKSVRPNDREELEVLIQDAWLMSDVEVNNLEDCWGTKLKVEWVGEPGNELRLIRTAGPDKTFMTDDDFKEACPGSLSRQK